MIPLEWMPPLMFGGLIVFMLIGFPVAFSLMAAGLFFSLIAISEGFLEWHFCKLFHSVSLAACSPMIYC